MQHRQSSPTTITENEGAATSAVTMSDSGIIVPRLRRCNGQVQEQRLA